MGISGINNAAGINAIEAPEHEATAVSRNCEQDGVSAFHEAAPVDHAEQPFDLFRALGELFGGQPNGNGPYAANKFDLGAILASIFDFAGTHQAKSESKEQGQVRAEISGEGGNAHFKTKGHAAAEAHAQAIASSEATFDHTGATARASAEASAGVSAEADGSITTDIGSIDGRARVSAEVYARLLAEAKAGQKGLSAAALAEAGAMANADAATNLQIADGFIAGHADARAEAGAGGKATAKAAVSFDPPEAIVNAKAESFAGARAGYSAKGGVAGIGYGIEAEVWAGAGAKAEINGGLDKDGKFHLDFSLGLAAGVGCMVKVKFEFDTKIFGKIAGDIIGAAGDVLGGIFGAVAGLFDGGSGNGKRAGQAISNAIRQIAPELGKVAADAAKQEVSKAEPKKDNTATPDHADTKSEPKPALKHDSGPSETKSERVYRTEKHGSLIGEKS
jgi:hypothetical protein